MIKDITIVGEIIRLLKINDVDGETMEYIVEQVGMGEQIHRQLSFKYSQNLQPLVEEVAQVPGMCLDDKENIFLNVLCNGALSEMACHGIDLDYKAEDYVDAKSKLNDPCYEDVLMQILKDGKELEFVDEEGGFGSEYTKSITIEDIYNMESKIPRDILLQYINEEDDAETGDMFLQYLLYGEIIFG